MVTVLIKKKYGQLVEELKGEYDNYDEAVKNHRFFHTPRKEITINGIKCWINFFGTHYCGYVRDKNISIDCKNLDYEPHGGFTDPYGFDCAHHDDIILHNVVNNGKGFPYQPTDFSYKGDSSSFKTRKYVIKELEKLTDAIIRYNKCKNSTN